MKTYKQTLERFEEVVWENIELGVDEFTKTKDIREAITKTVFELFCDFDGEGSSFDTMPISILAHMRNGTIYDLTGDLHSNLYRSKSAK